MAQFHVAHANIRINNDEAQRVCTLSNVSPAVPAQTAANFVTAIEKLYNNGPCTARMSVVSDIVRPAQA